MYCVFLFIREWSILNFALQVNFKSTKKFTIYPKELTINLKEFTIDK